MSNRKTGPRMDSDPTHGQSTDRPHDQAPDPHQPMGKAPGQEQDPKHRYGAFERAGDHSRQHQMGNKD